MDIKKNIFNAFKWLSLARILAQIVRWGSTFVVIKLLSPQDYGIAALAQSILYLLELFTSFGLGAAIIQSRDIQKRDLQVIFGMIISVNALLLSILWFSSSAISLFYDNPELELVLKVLALNFIFIILSSLPSSMLVREMKFKAIALSEVISGLCGASVSIVMAYAGYGYWALIFGGMSIILSRTIVQIIASPVFVFPVFKFSETRKFLTFGSLVMASIVIRYLYVSIDVIMAGKVWTPETLGVYAVALQLAVLPLNKMMPMIRQVAFPAYSKTQDDLDKVRHYMIKSLGLALAICFPIFFGISSVAVLMVPLILGTKWLAAAAPITFLCLVIPFRMMLELFEPALNAIGKPKTVFKTSCLILAVMTPTFVVSLQWEATGLALGWLLVFPLLSIYCCYRYCKVLDISFNALLSTIKTPILCSTAMFASVMIYIRQLENVFGPWLLLISAIALGFILYSLLIFLFDKALFQQIKAIIRK